MKNNLLCKWIKYVFICVLLASLCTKPSYANSFNHKPTGDDVNLDSLELVPGNRDLRVHLTEIDGLEKWSISKNLTTNEVESEVTINWNDQHQQIDGFGASCAWTAQNISETQADLFFSVEEGIGLSLLRNRISPDGTTLELATMKKAQARGAKIWSTPWSPPAEWKTNNDVTNGGRLISGYYQDYANLLTKYVQDMKDEGINLYAISVQNEPDYVAYWESCLWSEDELHAFVPYLYSALTNKGLTSTKIMIAENSGWDFDITSSTMNDPDTASMVGLLAAHAYWGAPSPVNTYGKQLWQTEVSSFDSFDGSMDNALIWATNIHEFMTKTEANAWHYWWLITNTNDNQGLLDMNGNPAKRMWAIGNFSKFVRPGYYRIGTSTAGNILGNIFVSAYKDPNTGKVTIVAINDNDVSIEKTFNLIDFNPALLVPWVTSDSFSLEQQPSIEISGNSFTYTLPALSVVTFVEMFQEFGSKGDAEGAGGMSVLSQQPADFVW